MIEIILLVILTISNLWAWVVIGDLNRYQNEAFAYVKDALKRHDDLITKLDIKYHNKLKGLNDDRHDNRE